MRISGWVTTCVLDNESISCWIRRIWTMNYPWKRGMKLSNKLRASFFLRKILPILRESVRWNDFSSLVVRSDAFVWASIPYVELYCMCSHWSRCVFTLPYEVRYWFKCQKWILVSFPLHSVLHLVSRERKDVVQRREDTLVAGRVYLNSHPFPRTRTR